MPLFSSFTGFGFLEFSSGPSECEKVYKALLAGYRDPRTGQLTIDTTVGTHKEAVLYAQACAIAGARRSVQSAGEELRPESSYYLLEAHERRFRMSPASTDTVAQRRQALYLKQRAARGPRYEAVLEGLTNILGDDLVAYRPISTSEAEAYPTDPSDGPGIFRRPDSLAKSVRLLTSACRPGDVGANYAVEVSYENWNTDQPEITILDGDLLVVDPDDWGVAEIVEVTASSGTGDERTFTARFTNPHGAGAFATNGVTPLWTNTKRHVLIVVSSEAAADPLLRARVNEYMSRVARSPTTWAIVEETTPGSGTVGPFTLGTSPLGATTVEEVTI